MFSELLNKIKQAIARMLNLLPPNKQRVDIQQSVSVKMRDKIDLWRSMYENDAPWLGGEEGTKNLGIPAEVCSEIARSVTIEMESDITETGEEEVDLEKEPTTRAEFMNKCYHNRLLNNLRHNIEYGMATGGMVIKPYVNNEQIYFDYLAQGEFIPLEFDDDGNITDIAFPDTFITGNVRYTKIERHVFDAENKVVTVINKAFASKDLENDEDLGDEVPLETVTQWAGLEEETVIPNCERSLYGFYRVPKANNVDVKSPLGVSVFSRATEVIETADRQYSRLDWEYEGGQLAVDVDPTVINTDSTGGGYYNNGLAQQRKRAFRGIDVDDMYSVFAPALRDSAYMQGLDRYLQRIEDLCEIYRGTLSDLQETARTATEIIMLKQRAYSNIKDNQKALETCLRDVIYSMDVYCDLYNLFPAQDWTVSFSWDDSIITDRNTQMEEKISLLNEGIIGKDEVRAWYTGESLEQARERIEQISEDNAPNLANDLFGTRADDSVNDEE